MTPALRAILFGSRFNPASLLTGDNGFYFDFTADATGAAIAAITSQPPSAITATQGTGSAQPVSTPGSPGYANFDGTDDALVTNLAPASAMTLALCGRVGSGNKALMGGRGADANARCFLATDVNGRLGAGWGTQNQDVIGGGGDIRGADFVAVFRADATTAELWINGVRVYSAAASGVGAGGVIAIGATSNNAVLAAFQDGRHYRTFGGQFYLPEPAIIPLSRALSRGVTVPSF